MNQKEYEEILEIDHQLYIANQEWNMAEFKKFIKYMQTNKKESRD